MPWPSSINYFIGLLLVIVLSVVLYFAYKIFYAADRPLDRTLFYGNNREHSTLLVFLPGVSDTADDFKKNGFVSELAHRKLPVDSMSVDAGVHYYIAKTIVQRLHTDIILPAMAEGYRHIWLVGVSLGGYGALLYTKEHPENVSGVITIAPYLGKQRIIQAIARAQGVDKLTTVRHDRDGQILALWAWLETYLHDSATRPPLFLAYGTEDKFAFANALMARHLAKEFTLTLTGQHNWISWNQLWQNLLDNKLLTAHWLPGHQ